MQLAKPFKILFFCLFIFSSCNYRLSYPGRTSAICIPYVEGDQDGSFTSILTRELSKRGLKISACAALSLEMCLLPPKDENIGFRYVAHGAEAVSNILAAEEARLSLAARFSLIDRVSGKPILGPLVVTDSITYDFEPDFSHLNFHDFSLGQLEMHYPAQDAAFTPLYYRLAEKIVDTLDASWYIQIN